MYETQPVLHMNLFWIEYTYLEAIIKYKVIIT